MKKQITIVALGLLTLAGGSWLAAQQRDSVRTTRSSDFGSPNSPAPADDLVREARPEEEPAKDSSGTPFGSQRPGENATRQPGRPQPAQGARGTRDFYHEDVARYPEEVRRIDEGRAFGQGSTFPGMQQRMTPEDAARMRAFQDAIKELREADNSDEKADARERVTKLVSEQLEVDLDNREKELAAIGQRAKELRKQLDERKAAKPELLKMLAMLTDNPQVGLGIPPEWMQMLMRGQQERYRQGFPINGPFGTSGMYPPAPPQPAMPPSAVYPSYSRESMPQDIGPAERTPNR